MTTSTLQRLLKYPNAAVFDKAPGGVPALRLSHPDGAGWVVADEVLTASAGGVDHQYDLAQHTVATLGAALEADGFAVDVSPEFSGRGAAVLAEGQGDERLSNGDRLYAFTSPLWAILSGYGAETREAHYQLNQALRQMIIWQSEGEWLDLWGALYDQKRPAGDTDAEYAPKIPKEAFRVRVNGLAIEQAVKDITGKTVEIREPWKNMFTLDGSALSGADHLPDEKYYGYFLIHPVSREAIDWTDVLQVIHRNRAAGIEVYAPAVELPARHVIASPPAEYLASMGGLQLRGIGAWPGGEAPLGVMRLDDNDIVLNHPVMMYLVSTFANTEGLDDTQQVGSPRNIAYASITLSDGVPLGDENAILSRGWLTLDTLPPATLSDELAPSDYGIVELHERVERIILSQHVDGALDYPTDGVDVGLLLTNEETRRFGVVRVEDRGWTGGWDSETWLPAHARMGMSMSSLALGNVLNVNFFLNLSTIDIGTPGSRLDIDLVTNQSTIQ